MIAVRGSTKWSKVFASDLTTTLISWNKREDVSMFVRSEKRKISMDCFLIGCRDGNMCSIKFLRKFNEILNPGRSSLTQTIGVLAWMNSLEERVFSDHYHQPHFLIGSLSFLNIGFVGPPFLWAIRQTQMRFKKMHLSSLQNIREQQPVCSQALE